MASVPRKGVAKRRGEIEVPHDIDLEVRCDEFVVTIAPAGKAVS